MASVMVGRSCGYGVHLRSCFPSLSASSVPPNSLSSLSCLASCFFLRFSLSSCCNRRLKLCVAPPFALGRRAFFVHGEAEQERSSPSSAFVLHESPAMKQASSRKKKVEEGAEVNSSTEVITLDAQSTCASSPEELSSSLPLSARSKVKATRRKKAGVETPLQASEDGLAGDEKPPASKRTRKKTVMPDNGNMDVATASTEERVPSKLLPRRKRSISAEFEDIVKVSTLDEPSLSQLAPSDAVSSTSKKATRKKKMLEEESTMSVGRKQKASKDKQKVVEEGSHVVCEDIAKSATSVKRARNKKTSSLLLAQEESSLQAKQASATEEINKTLNLKSETLVLQEKDAKPRGRKKLSLRAKEAAINPSEVDAALPGSLGTALTDEKPSIGSEANVLAVKEIEEESPPKRRGRVSKAKESASQITSAGFLKTLEPNLSQEVRRVKNSVDKASLTDGMPVLSVTDTHTTSWRRQQEALRLPKDSNMGNNAVTESGACKISTDTTEALPKLLPILEDVAVKSIGALEAKKEEIDRIKSSTSLIISTEQVDENESEIFNKANFANDADQKWAVPRGLPCKEDPISQRSMTNDSGGIFCVPGKYPPTPRWSEKANHAKGSPVTTQRWAPKEQGNMFRILDKSNQSRENIISQQWAQWKKSDTMIKDAAKGAVVPVNERTSSVQFKTTGHNDRNLQHGYNLANIDRVYGTEHKKKKEFSVRKVVANQASTLSYMQIYGTGFDTGDTMPTVLLFFDRRRFIFNVGEGLHRFCMEHRFKLSKIDHVFLTRVCSETTGGLPGLILTLSDLGESGLTAQTWGPSSLQELTQAMRTFIPSGWMEHTHCFSAGNSNRTLIENSSSPPILLLEDELIKISAVLLHPDDKPNHLSAESDSPEEKIGGVISTVYICELATVRGKFDPDKAQAKGLKPGYKYGKLQKGESVMSDDGTIMVHPEDVLGPSSPGPIMVLVDCPSSSHIPSLTSSTSLQSYFSQTGKVVNCMIHIGPRFVTRSKEYRSWMENFRETDHIMARKEVKVLGTPTLRYSAKLLSKLNLVCPQLFPILEPDVIDQQEAANDYMVDGGNLLKYHFRPLTDLGPDVSEVPESFNHVAAQKYWRTENPEVIRAQELAGQVMKRWSQMGSSSSTSEDKGLRKCQNLPACLDHVSRDEMELVFLGTGSSQPAKHRNVTGIYIHLYERGGILLDCGEGTYAQLKRRYGAKGADDVLMGLKCIWISHMHADHFSGLARILSARRQLLQAQSALEPILVVGPRRLKIFLGAYQEVEDLGMVFLDCSQTTSEVQSWVNEKNLAERDGAAVQKRMGLVNTSSGGGPGKSGMQHVWKRPGFHIQQGIDVAGRENLRRVLNLLGLKDLCSVPVVHCPHAFAVVLEAEGRKISESNTTPGWKLVFSGDTRPCQALVEAARGATILIHEATFDDDLIAEAVKKNHSMTNEAIQVGVAAQVYRIFLTHFSQRYPTIPSFDNCYSDRTCIAFDMMSVNLADLPIVPEFVPALQLLFRDQTEVEEDLALSV